MSSESESKDTSSDQNVNEGIDNLNGRIDDVNDRISGIQNQINTLQTNQVEGNAKLDMMLQMLQRSMEDNDKNKKDMQGG